MAFKKEVNKSNVEGAYWDLSSGHPILSYTQTGITALSFDTGATRNWNLDEAAEWTKEAVPSSSWSKEA
jgi:hypothetical protein